MWAALDAMSLRTGEIFFPTSASSTCGTRSKENGSMSVDSPVASEAPFKSDDRNVASLFLRAVALFNTAAMSLRTGQIFFPTSASSTYGTRSKENGSMSVDSSVASEAPFKSDDRNVASLFLRAIALFNTAAMSLRTGEIFFPTSASSTCGTRSKENG
eukprot:Gregarina_sp_Poly_1__4498@NODE_2418_length_2157_cov_20_403828_g1538_i0_p3_GENE_NODE_2418_length_2157_cov_20_403828_g1538_i0NODE_2418_length_2157_cov_20_403828_g1538_i0_p3_ORF_typecomplete_len158_score21_92_NODE_2418_length_2157_cov_20_403828_g1538_i012261699